MKLFTRITLQNLLLAMLVLAGGIFWLNIELESVVAEDFEEKLESDKIHLLDIIKQQGKIPDNTFLLGGTISVDSVNGKQEECFFDISLYSSEEYEMAPYKGIKFNTTSASGKNLCITILRPSLESEDLTESIIQVVVEIFILLIILTIIVNTIIARKALKPFHKTLKQLQSFRISDADTVKFDATRISEFKELNTALGIMLRKMQTDYKNLRSFTENASHEMQTPIAIMQTKIEMLLQRKELSGEEADIVGGISESLKRLSRLVRGLLLIAKIENHQYEVTEKIDLLKIIKEKLSDWEELIAEKNISIITEGSKNCIVSINSQLAEILVSNLLSNALRHNVKGGKINISLMENKIVFSNTGKPLQSNAENLFQRFQKDDPSSATTGLGLCIVKEICEIYHFKVSYTYENSFHTIMIVVS
ncbi:MAG: histidine kinase dimerization/phospho-acceptor domain-containing protein [Bacteroidota bacterium]